VPTGNFGDIFAGYVAKADGPAGRTLVIATNDNDILARTLETGIYEMRGVVKTTSPSMDIQVSSNFERLLFDAAAAATRKCAARHGQPETGAALRTRRKDAVHDPLRLRAGTAHVSETAAMIRHVNEKSGYLLDPHTAIGVHVARQKTRGAAPMVVLGTAHPAKFPAAVKEASASIRRCPHGLAT
jgi:threonine synthase